MKRVVHLVLAVAVADAWSSCTCADLPDIAYACEPDGGCAQEGFRCDPGPALCVRAGQGGGAAGAAASGGRAGGATSGGSAAGGTTSGGSAAGGAPSGGGAAGGTTSGGSAAGTAGGAPEGGGAAGGVKIGGGAAGGTSAAGGAPGGGSGRAGGAGGGTPVGGGDTAGGDPNTGGGNPPCMPFDGGLLSNAFLFLADGGFAPGYTPIQDTGALVTASASSSGGGSAPGDAIDLDFGTSWFLGSNACSSASTSGPYCCAASSLTVRFESPQSVRAIAIRGTRGIVPTDVLTARLEIISLNGPVLWSGDILLSQPGGDWAIAFMTPYTDVQSVRFSPVLGESTGPGIAELTVFQ